MTTVEAATRMLGAIINRDLTNAFATMITTTTDFTAVSGQHYVAFIALRFSSASVMINLHETMCTIFLIQSRILPVPWLMATTNGEAYNPSTVSDGCKPPL